jgi:hypothetical protein
MAKLGTKYFTRGKVMIGVAAEGLNRPLIPFNPSIDKVDYLDLTKICDGINQKQAEELLQDLCAHFIGKPAQGWVDLSNFVDLADSKAVQILKEIA